MIVPRFTGISAVALCVCFASGATRAEPADDPRTWRPMVLVDLRLVGPRQAPYSGIWADLIAENNERNRKRRPHLAPVSLAGNAPTQTANIVIRSPEVTILLSIFHAAGFCEAVAGSTAVFRCPMRLVRYERGASSIREGKACFAVREPGGGGAAAYASYDVIARALRLGVLQGASAVEGCSQSVPVKESER